MSRAANRTTGTEPNATASGFARVATLCGLADAWAESCPDRAAWSDQPGRGDWSGRPARSLTWRAVVEHSMALAMRFRRLALPPGAPLGICLPNGSDWMIALLAAERAGLTPCLLPVGASSADLAAAIEAAAIEAVVTQAAIGPLRPADTICAIAARYFRLRHVLAFGPGVPDGVTDLDGERGRSGVSPAPDDGGSRGIVTFEHADGHPWPVLRSGGSLLAAAGALAATVRPKSFDTIVTLLGPDDLKALVSGPVLSLLSGCQVEAHGLFSHSDLHRAFATGRTRHLVAPGWMELALRAELGDRLEPGRLALILAHDAPAPIPPADAEGPEIVDILALGERAILVASRRSGLASTLAGPDAASDGAAASWLQARCDKTDRIRVTGPAAMIEPLDHAAHDRRTAIGMDLADDDEGRAATLFGVERESGLIVGVRRQPAGWFEPSS